jgi:hypothetical protein
MFCNECGAPNPDSAKFCNTCGTGIKVSTHSSPRAEPDIVKRQFPIQLEIPSETPNTNSWSALGYAGSESDSSPSSRKYFGIALAIICVVILVRVTSNDSSDSKTINQLPFSSEDILSAYNSRPPLIRSETNDSGNSTSFYRGPYHVLELEEANGRLIRAAIRFDGRSTIIENDNAAIAVTAWMGVFVMKVGSVTENLDGVLRELGGSNVWSSEPSETVVNGVRIRRRMQGDSLVFDAVSAQ